MTSDFAPDLATQRQIRAADPAHSVWLSANAGSGKTKVLTDRVARLLLGGTEPQKILCLTYTKAAASEMQNRLLRRLGGWAMLGDRELRAELDRLGRLGPETGVSDDRLAQARRLFAQAIEAPGGLKIQTIHAFCGTLLRRFPLEAGVPHGFAELDERSSDEMRGRILEEIASGPERAVFDRLAEHLTTEDLGGLLAEIGRHADAFEAEADPAAIRAALGLPPGFGLSDLPGLAFDGDEKRLLDSVIGVMKGQSATMKALATELAKLRHPLDLAGLAQLQGLLLRKTDGQPSSKILTKKAAEDMGEDLAEAFRDLADRVAAAKDAERGLRIAERSEALAGFARAFLPKYRAQKARGGWLDFDDLIERAGALLSSPSVAQWVLFRLDGGIDHILVDEAQDTSPGQWRVIERLADEFTAGAGARDDARTIFVVGDRKQSIYSFQGADLQRFEAMRALFSDKFAAIDRPIASEELRHSFRSAAAILGLVDRTFAAAASVGLGGVPEHEAFRTDLPGRVDLWPVVAKPDAAEAGDWEDPVDLPGREDANVVLARTIAAEIRAMIRGGVQIPDGPGSRPVHEGDFLILVQRRSLLFSEVIRACKAAGLAVAGADRLRLGAEIAVKDILAVLAFLATPEDDLSLAAALRSPVFGWSEAELYALAQPRKGYLWAALRASGTRPETLAILQDLLGLTDFLRPYDLIERLLNRHGARERLIARLGAEAEDGIDELIAQSLAYESAEIPSLTGFLGWLGADEVEVKRQLENEGRTIRVMTVHGSKGLEAPIVILPDTAKPRAEKGGGEIVRSGEVALWKGASALNPAAVSALTEAAKQRLREEKMRLLYVALTRAEKWLIVAAAGEVGTGEESWYALTAEAMIALGAEETVALSAEAQALGTIRRRASGDWPEPVDAAAAPEAVVPMPADLPADLPDWIARRAPHPARGAASLAPSDLGGAKALPGETEFAEEEEVKRRGRQLHLLLEHLPLAPQPDWPGMAQMLLGDGPDRADAVEQARLLAQAGPVIAALGRAGCLGPDSLAEVEITAEIAALGGQRIHGVIDRLVVSPGRVHLLDYKSNRVVPEGPQQVPLGLLRQLAAYRAALVQIYPGREIVCSLVWTATAEIMAIPPAALEVALAGWSQPERDAAMQMPEGFAPGPDLDASGARP